MPRRISLLFVTTSISSYGGIEETLRVLCLRLNPDLFRIGICTIQDSPHEILDEFKEMDVEVYCIGRQGYFFDFFTALKIFHLIKSFKADIVNTHNNKGNFHGRIAAFLLKRPSIVTTHHDLGDIFFSKNPKLKKQKRSDLLEIHGINPYNLVHAVLYPYLNVKLNNLNSKVITVSDAVRDIYTSNPVDPRFETVYAPYDDTVFKMQYEGFKGRKIFLGTVGRFFRQKGHIYLLQAMKMLVQSRNDIELILIGDGPLKTDIERFIKENDLTSFVKILDCMPHDASLYDGIDIYIQPSVSEGCSITLLEAMGVGIPVIASDIEGPRELIISGKTGVLVPPKNPQALKDAVLRLIENKEKAAELGKTGNRRVLEKFSSNIFIRRMTGIYQDLVHFKKFKGLRRIDMSPSLHNNEQLNIHRP